MMYGMSAFGLGKQLGISRGQAQEYVDLYFDRYPGVRKYMDDTREMARDKGYVETEFGRRLYLPEINDRNGQRRQYAERSAINAPMIINICDGVAVCGTENEMPCAIIGTALRFCAVTTTSSNTPPSRCWLAGMTDRSNPSPSGREWLVSTATKDVNCDSNP